ncbi:MAG: response regulator [candidate division Zixibacteria bacterium]|nr:response regulator [candidate division Zixibacteria bacterium]
MEREHSVLVIDDEPIIRVTTVDALEAEGFRAKTAATGKEGLEMIAAGSFDIIITDLRLPDMNGLAILKEVKRNVPTAEVVIITAYGSVDSAVEAMKTGAYDYVTKPFTTEELLLVLKRLLEMRHLRQENIALRKQIERESGPKPIVGKSPQMKRIYELIETVSQVDTTVMIYGQSGTGKELIANAIHFSSPRKKGPFIKVNCAALPESLLESELFGHEKGAFTGALTQKKGRFELAHRGTLFLDEIGDISPGVQVKLLRVLQEHQFERLGGTRTLSVDVRIICATQRNLKGEIRKRRFREDLYFRLNVVPIHLPPLRERKEDILPLADHFIHYYSEQMGRASKGLSQKAIELLGGYPFPGNIRELENAMERAVALNQGGRIEPEDLPEEFRSHGVSLLSQEVDGPRSLGSAVKSFEKCYIEEVLREAGGKKGKASELLKISRKTLWEKMKEYHISS